MAHVCSVHESPLPPGFRRGFGVQPASLNMKRFTLCVVVLLAIAGRGASSQRPLATPGAWGQSLNGLRLGISGARTAPSQGARFIVALQNTSTRNFVVNIGQMLGNGAMFSSAVRLALTDSAGHTRELQFFNRQYLGVGGWLGDFTVALPAGSAHTLPGSLDQYWSEATKEIGLRLAPGRYRISARFEGTGAIRPNPNQDVASLNFWRGMVQSNIFEFDVAP